MVKADDKVVIDDEKESYTNFEELSKRVEILQEIIEEIAQILNENNIHRLVKVSAPEFNTNRLYEELYEECEDVKREKI